MPGFLTPAGSAQWNSEFTHSCMPVVFAKSVFFFRCNLASEGRAQTAKLTATSVIPKVGPRE